MAPIVLCFIQVMTAQQLRRDKPPNPNNHNTDAFLSLQNQKGEDTLLTRVRPVVHVGNLMIACILSTSKFQCYLSHHEKGNLILIISPYLTRVLSLLALVTFHVFFQNIFYFPHLGKMRDAL